ncbi:hypothetical protein [Nocardiopsis sp. CNR-923]|uniref:hypothetical protein n=1 Tax=Nocardiopsis sp. CNR-923 TaxID=1904965 RepID=UPI0021CC7369|nr:hypothetical protein [Nocardiopsis sp. CNR-923]
MGAVLGDARGGGRGRAQETARDTSDPEEAEDTRDREAPRDEPSDAAEDDGEESRAPWWVAASIVGVALAAVLAVPVLRLLRGRRRLRSGTPDRRVLGAWRELRDALRLCSVTPPPGNTVSDTVALVTDLLPARARGWAEVDLGWLGRAVNRVAFSPGVAVTEAQASSIVEGVRRQTRELRLSRGRARALAWWFDPRPLLWRDR